MYEEVKKIDKSCNIMKSERCIACWSTHISYRCFLCDSAYLIFFDIHLLQIRGPFKKFVDWR